jgi:hypothetical protein
MYYGYNPLKLAGTKHPCKTKYLPIDGAESHILELKISSHLQA